MTSMPLSRLMIALGLLIVLAGLLSPSPIFRFTSMEPTKSAVVATVGSRPVTLREVEQTAALALYQADQQRSQLLHQALQRTIDTILLEAEASRKGLSVSQLLNEAAQSESIARLANLPAPVKRVSTVTKPDTQNPHSALPPEEEARIRQALLVSLRRQTEIHLALPVVEPPFLPVST
ncbi:MAG TPA: SurA N-terminal domain-containing protein, partial [Desulfatiglandales bacterium]|nr:SurA N-terminal domain-containing protein [Desulfatiglandales bacterium]